MCLGMGLATELGLSLGVRLGKSAVTLGVTIGTAPSRTLGMTFWVTQGSFTGLPASIMARGF